MKKILLLLVISLLGIGLFGQSKFKKGIQVGRNGATVDSITVDGDYIYFHSGEDKWSNDTLNGIAGISNKVDINTAYRDTFKNLKSGYINVKDFGAVGDGVTDDRDAIYNALVAARDQKIGVVLFPKSSGNYKINSGIVVENFEHKITVFGYGATIDASEAGDNTYVIRLAGKRGDNYSINYDINLGDDFLVNSFASSLERGDVIQICMNDSSRSPLLGKEMNGEFARIKDISNDTITVYGDIYETYEAGVAYFNKISGSVQISGLHIIGNVDQGHWGISVKDAENVTINDNNVIGCDRVGIELYNVYGFNLYNNYTNESDRIGYGYGITASGCQDGSIFANRLYGARHAISGGGSNRGFSRNIKIRDNIVNNVFDYGINMHPGSDYIEFENNTIYGYGLMASVNNTKIINNKIYLFENTHSGMLLSLDDPDPTITYNSVIIKGNEIFNNEMIGASGIIMYAADTTHLLNNLIIDNNIFHNMQSSCIKIEDNDEHFNIENILITNNIIETNSFGVYLDNIVTKNIEISDNVMTTNTQSISVGIGNIDNFIIKNNLIKQTNENSNPIYFSNKIVDNLYVENNILSNTDSCYTGQLILKAFDNVYFNDNLIQYAFYGGYQIGDVDSLYMDGNIFKNVSGNFTNNASWTSPSWEISQDSLARNIDLSTSGSSSVNWDNITNFNTYTETSDSIHIGTDLNYTLKTVDVISGDTLRVRVYGTFSNKVAYCNMQFLQVRTAYSADYNFFEVQSSYSYVGTPYNLQYINLHGNTDRGTRFDVPNTIASGGGTGSYYDVYLINKSTETTYFNVNITDFFGITDVVFTAL